jgi:hypothetical protein
MPVSDHRGTPDDTNWSFQCINEEFSSSRSGTQSHPLRLGFPVSARSRKSRDCGEAYCSASHKKSRRLISLRRRKGTIYGWKLVRLLVIVMVLLLSFVVPPAVGKERQLSAGSQQAADNIQEPSFLELLEFLAQWETNDGRWVDPTDLDWLLTPEQESKDDEKKRP